MKNFCVSLTSIPPRFETLEKTIRSINSQIKKPQKIFLNIPLKYKRYPDSKYDISRLEIIFENLKIIRCKDYGPGTKLLGSLEYLMDYDYVVLIDDDHIYNKDNTEILNKVLNTTPDSIIIFYGNLGEKKDLYNSYDVCIYSSIVATKLDSNKIINHYSDIIEEEINSEENNEDNKIYVLTPK